jgi:hypothetical protein
MGINSTPFLSYHEIQVEEIDIYDDAWGFNSEFSDVINLLNLVKQVPGKRLTEKLIERVRQQD